VTDNLLGMAAGNSVADWLMSETTPESGAWTQIGTKEERRRPETGEVYFLQSDEWLYPSYLAWCLAHGRSWPVALRKFRDTLADMAETLGHPVTTGRHPKTRAYGVKGLRLARKEDPAPEGTWKAIGRIQSLYRKDRKDSGPNFVPEFSPRNKDSDAGEDRL
jgi:putative DNA primase/helicase